MSGDARFDVVVVGAGAGGAAVAYGLCLRGLTVLLLDAGPRFDPATDYPLTGADWDARAFPQKPGSTGTVTFAPGQKLTGDEPLLRSGSRGLGPAVTDGRRWMEAYHHVRGIGGSTLHFTGESHRLHPAAMQMKSRFGVAADWPIDYAGLEPYYLRAEELIGVAGPATQGARWRSREFPLPPHPLSYAARTLGRGAQALGLDWQANSRAALSLPWHGRAPCNHCGACNKGCPRGDKGSADITFVAAALATGRCTVRPDAPVVRIEEGSGDRVTAVLVGRPDGRLERIQCPAAGAGLRRRRDAAPAARLRRPRQRQRRGRPQLHGHARGDRRRTASQAAARPPRPAQRRHLLGLQRARRHSRRGRRLSLLQRRRRGRTQGLAGFALRAVPGWGRAHAREVRRCGATHCMWAPSASACPMPTAASISIPRRATVSACRWRGSRQCSIRATSPACASWRSRRARCWRPAARRRCSRPIPAGTGSAPPTCSAPAGWATIPPARWSMPTAAHHRWRNLWITDASVFPSSGGGEAPSLTIHALALRTAERVGRGG